MDYCPFPPPGIAAFSLPDTISAPPQSQRLTPFRTASPPLPFRNCHSEGIRQGPVLGLRWFLPEMPEEPQLQIFHRPYVRVRASSPQKTIPSDPIPRTIKSCAPASTVSSRASVLCWSFFAFSRRLSAQPAAPSLLAPTPAPTNNRQPAVTISRIIPPILQCSPVRLVPPAYRQILYSQLSPHRRPACSPQIPLFTRSLQP